MTTENELKMVSAIGRMRKKIFLRESSLIISLALIDEGLRLAWDSIASFSREDAIIHGVVHCAICHGFVINSAGKPQHGQNCLMGKVQCWIDKSNNLIKDIRESIDNDNKI